MTKSAQPRPRFYYQPIARISLRGGALLNFLGWLLMTAGPGIAVAVRAMAAVVAFTSLFYFWNVGGRGLEAGADGIRFRRGVRWHFIPWPEIKAFSIKRPALSPTVYVDLVSSESRIVPFTQGRLTRSGHGKSRDTVAVLNSELEQARRRIVAAPAAMH